MVHKIDHSDVPIRLFKSDFLEFFTHISPITIIVIWLPIAVYFLVKPIVLAGGLKLYAILSFIAGLFIWTLTEYTMHRFVFHFKPRNPFQERISFLFHGVHHAQPQCKTRLVMPLPVSIPLALIFYSLFYLILNILLGVNWLEPLFSGFITGYLIYDLTHYATHHFPMRAGYLKFLKRHHMQHHYKAPDKLFGVSSPIWDYVFNTTLK